MTLAEFLKRAIEDLKNTGIDNPQLDARILACHVLGMDRAELLSQSQRTLTDNEIQIFTDLITQRAQHISVARIIGKREFWGLDFGLNEATLEPRPDSECLVEAVLSSFRRKPESSLSSSGTTNGFNLDPGLRRNDDDSSDYPFLRLLDLGTGTGCLLLSLLHELPNATGIGIDLAPRAVEQAQANAMALGLEKRAVFQAGDWFSAIAPQSSLPQEKGEFPTFDIIISNPPYIPAADIPALMPDVREHDPMLALDGGKDGLAPYRLLIPQLKNYLNPNGLAAFEVGIGQAQQVAELFQTNGFAPITTHKDLGGVDRCISASFPKP